MKILHLITDLRPAGAERIVYEIARNVNKKKFQFEVCSLSERRGLVQEWLEIIGVPVHSLGMRHKRDLLRLWALKEVLDQVRPDILQTHMFHSNLSGRIFGMLSGVPVVISTVHIFEKRFRPWHFWLDRWTIMLADVEICVSEAVKKLTYRRSHIPDHKLRVLRNGVDVDFFASSSGREEIRLELGVSDEEKLIGSVGRLNKQKGYIYLLRAFSIIARKNSEVRLVLVGDGPERSMLEELSRSLGILGRVVFVGFREDVPKYLSAFDIFCMPSLFEGHPLALCEAMAASLPIVASDIPTISEVVENGIQALLVPPRDENKIAEALMEILNDEIKARRLSQASSDRAKKEYSLERMVEEYERLYDSFFVWKGGIPKVRALRVSPFEKPLG